MSNEAPKSAAEIAAEAKAAKDAALAKAAEAKAAEKAAKEAEKAAEKEAKEKVKALEAEAKAAEAAEKAKAAEIKKASAQAVKEFMGRVKYQRFMDSVQNTKFSYSIDCETPAMSYNNSEDVIYVNNEMFCEVTTDTIDLIGANILAKLAEASK